MVSDFLERYRWWFAEPKEAASASSPFWYISHCGMVRCVDATSLIIISYFAPYSSYTKNLYICRAVRCRTCGVLRIVMEGGYSVMR